VRQVQHVLLVVWVRLPPIRVNDDDREVERPRQEHRDDRDHQQRAIDLCRAEPEPLLGETCAAREEAHAQDEDCAPVSQSPGHVTVDIRRLLKIEPTTDERVSDRVMRRRPAALT
jgi:hypothetical protein